MKTNGVDSGGGRLRDEWRKPYAEYLVQYVRFYAQSGVNVTHLGFLNEPDFSTSYASMQMDASAAAAFIRDYLWPAIKAAGLANQLTINCCEGTGWSVAAGYARTLNSLPADIPLIMTGHTYTSGISGPLPTTRKTWETECSDLNSRWNTAWSGGAADGLTWANNIHTGLTTGNCSAYLWWEGTQDRATNNNNNEKLILVDNGNYEVSKRLWAFAQFSRSARPGAVRVGVSGGSGLRLTAFVNVDGSVAVVIINGGGSAQNLSITGALTADQVAAGPATAEMFTTDNTRDMARSAVTVAADGTVSGVSVPGRAMVSVVIRPAAAPATAARRW